MRNGVRRGVRDNAIRIARLLRLASPALPVGTFSYSQGLEDAVDNDVVHDEESARRWIGGLLTGSMARFELPMLVALHRAWVKSDYDRAACLNDEFLASRETAELRAETLQMGAALVSVLQHDGEHDVARLKPLTSIVDVAFPTSFAFAASCWQLSAVDTATGYGWSWLENQVTAAMKLVPLGQRAGQRLQAQMTSLCAQAVETAQTLPEDEWSNFAPLFAIASSRHETQYSRLFRS